MIDALRQVKAEFPEFKYVQSANEKSTNKQRMTAEELAVQLDRLSHDFDPYDYQDTLNGDRDHVEDITYSLYTGGAKHYCSYLDDIIAEGGALATDAENLKEKLMAFEPSVSSDRVPMVRVDMCDSSEFEHERYMPVGAFDSAVERMDQAWSKDNAGKDEDEMKSCRVQFTLFYADDGEMKK